jgi:preprotein translocase subunit SecF
MVEFFKNPQINWIRIKKYFIASSITLLLLGAISVQLRGFNLGVDFTGGTLMTVRFKQQPSLDEVRSALGTAGIDAAQVTLQPVINSPNELIIRAPQLGGNETERRIDKDKRAIIRALQRLNPAGEASAGKVNINSIDSSGIEQELRLDDSLGISGRAFPSTNPYRQIGDRIIDFRDHQQKGFIQDIELLQALDLGATGFEADQNKIRSAILNRFYAGKIDLNLAGTSDIEDALSRIDPLGVGAGSEIYKRAAQAIADYRRNSNGVISDLRMIQTQDVSAGLLSKMEPYFTEGSFAVISAEVVGPVVGADLRNRAIYVTLAALAGMLIFVALRFEWIQGVAAILAVFHDVMVILGLFSLFQWEINLTVIAALLTLVGYSMNDTIVVFDRIRENTRLHRRESLTRIVNDSINQTLSRTIITAGLTFMSALAIVLFGGEVLRGFGLVLTIGIALGTYDSIVIAAPTMLWWTNLTAKREARRKQAERKNSQSIEKSSEDEAFRIGNRV